MGRGLRVQRAAVPPIFLLVAREANLQGAGKRSPPRPSAAILRWSRRASRPSWAGRPWRTGQRWPG